jgi:transcriptional regulator with XRE-family HTH domain
MRRLSCHELAERAGLSVSMVSAVEAGVRAPSVIVLMRLTAALRVRPGWHWRTPAYEEAARTIREVGAVAAMSSGGEHANRLGRVRESLDEQARRKGARPLRSVDELRDDEVFESDEELRAFLDDLDRSRHPAAFLSVDYVVYDTNVASLAVRAELPATDAGSAGAGPLEGEPELHVPRILTARPRGQRRPPVSRAHCRSTYGGVSPFQADN